MINLLSKEKMVAAALLAKEKNEFVYIIHSLSKGLELVTTNWYSVKEVLKNDAIIKCIKPDNILIWDVDNWKGKDCSISVLVEELNRSFIQIPN